MRISKFIILILFIPNLTGASSIFKLPYEYGEKFYLIQGYDAGRTHKELNLYALDFTKDGCEAYGKNTVATNSGVVLEVMQSGYNRGAGTYVIIDHGEGIYSKYLHLIKDSVVVSVGENVVQSNVIGKIGNTGDVEGIACPEHGGTHLHFAMVIKDNTGKFTPYKPEPISGYTNLLAGNWYTSDNHLAKAETPVISEEKKQGWFSKLWNNLKLVFKKTEQAIDRGEIKIEAITSNVNFDNTVSKNSKSEESISSESTNTFKSIVTNEPVKSTTQTTEISKPSTQSSLGGSTTTTNTTVSSPSIQIPTIPYPGFGGGGGGSALAPSIAINNESTNTNENTDNMENVSTSTSVTLLMSSVPVITSPENFSSFATSTIIFQGTSTPNSAVFAENFDEIGVAGPSGEWQISLTLDQGTTTLNFFSIEDGKATSSPITHSVYVDSIAPVISLAVVECQYSIVESRCVLPVSSTTIAVSVNENASTTIFVNGSNVGVTSDLATTTIIDVEHGLYEIFAVSVDNLGNISTSTVQNIEIFKKPIVINEIAWAGTSESAFNEWIELESQIGESLNMSRFSLEAKDQVLQIRLQNFLDSYGYYLIERTDDDSVPTLSANLVTAFSGSGGGSGLSNSGEELFLLYHMGQVSKVIDKTPAVSVCGGWCNANEASGGTMFRLNPSRDGGLNIAWGDDPNTYVPIFNSTGIQIAGTPKAQNYSNPMPQI